MSNRKGRQTMTAVEAPHIDAAVSIDEQWSFAIVFANLGERNKFLAAAHEVTVSGDASPMFPFMAKYIKRWPYANLNPSKVADYDDLTTEQWDDEVVPRLTKA